MQQKRNLNEGIRLAALLLEFFMLFVAYIIFSFPATNNGSFGIFRITHESYKLETLNDPLIYLTLVAFSLLFCKDCINGQSIAKRMLRLQVVDNKTGAVATPMQCFIRNSTLILLPIEFLLALVRPDKRIGDKIAGTKLVIYDEVANHNPERSLKKYILPVVSAYVLSMALSFGLSMINFNVPKTPFVANTWNETESKTLEKILTDNFNKYYTVSVKCYDSIENQNLKYISMICFFKEPFFDKIGETDQIRTQTIEHLYNLFPRESFNGRVQYVYQTELTMMHWEEPIGITIKKTTK